jgi:oxalate decarboxylase/phosphoglucose isomerase-like protein (cupin superfamily)
MFANVIEGNYAGAAAMCSRPTAACDSSSALAAPRASRAARGDFVLIPKGVVHREGNPGTEPNEAIVFRVGEGEVLVNVDGP